MFTIQPNPPFNFKLTVGIYNRFRDQIVDVFRNGVYERILQIDSMHMLIQVKSTGSIDAPTLIVNHTPKNVEVSKIEEKVKWILSLDLDLTRYYSIVKDDEVLSKVNSLLYGLKPPRTPSVYEAVVIAISEQQLALPVANAIRSRLIQKFGKAFHLKNKLYYAFPTPEAVAAADIGSFKGLGLSTRKSEYIVGVSRQVVSGKLDLERLKNLSNTEVVEKLTSIKGIGMWTCEYIMVRGMGRLDVAPADDLGLRRVVSKFYYNGKKVSGDQVRKLSNTWGDYRGLAAYYLLRAGQEAL